MTSICIITFCWFYQLLPQCQSSSVTYKIKQLVFTILGTTPCTCSSRNNKDMCIPQASAHVAQCICSHWICTASWSLFRRSCTSQFHQQYLFAFISAGCCAYSIQTGISHRVVNYCNSALNPYFQPKIQKKGHPSRHHEIGHRILHPHRPPCVSAGCKGQLQ